MSDEAKPSRFMLPEKPWLDNANPIWLTSTVSLRRNIEKYKFPGKLSNDRRKQLVDALSKELVKLPEADGAKLFLGEELAPTEKEFLMEHFLTTESYHQAHAGEAFLINENADFLATLNIDDHLHLRLTDNRGEVENAWARLVKIETGLSKIFNFSFSPKYGFLTSDPTLCGTALKVTVFLQVPALIHLGQIDEFLEKTLDDSLFLTGIQGNPTEVIGDVIAIQNNYTLGVTEENILAAVRSFASKVVSEEQKLRKTIAKDESAEVKDKVSRAYGILVHSYQIDAIEALNAISLMKLGQAFDWVKGIDVAKLNHLFFIARRAHLLGHLDSRIGQEQLPHKRAEFIHKAMQHVELTI